MAPNHSEVSGLSVSKAEASSGSEAAKSLADPIGFG
jgi:hypothetical protein